MTDFKVSCQNVLRLFVELALIFRNVWGVEEVEERIVRDLLRHRADCTASLMLLLLLNSLDRDVLARLPVDLATSAFVNLRSFKRKRFFAIDFATQKVSESKLFDYTKDRKLATYFLVKTESVKKSFGPKKNSRV